ncbi:SDR family NAD(P)-dependent oxidoreductase [Rhodoferax sp.]|uniref:SDR family NAD(P)-dependent oxidoreductase n=1 Tax=Rhodoferax sp. TaxID=50421 RepID=UPI001EC0C441|nr:SDR family NAD(P)-dependent oxidoreductase [Rhodoferax sp.]MBT9506478.1 SDR family NAD(P)-dependent oxidoreductase [Rhodoferax sp.]
MKEFKGKVAVITGAASGIGKAIAERAAQAGMKLVLADVDAAGLDKVVAEFSQKGCEAVGLRTDVSRESEVMALADLAFERFGKVHLLVNNAGVAATNTAWTAPQSEWDRVMGINLYGVTNGLRAFVPRMLEANEEGHIVNTASAAGLIPAPSFASYNASKFAVVAVSEGLHHDLSLRKTKLGVSVLCPEWVKTSIHTSVQHEPDAKLTAARQADPVLMSITSTVSSAVETGISPDEVADKVFAAVQAKQFYIITHQKTTLPAVEKRMQDMLQGRNPSMMKFN